MKIGIAGSGFVGATAEYALVMQGVGREVGLVDKNPARANAEADDIRYAAPLTRSSPAMPLPTTVLAAPWRVLSTSSCMLSAL
jgi:malate/lactate dehydrogenase